MAFAFEGVKVIALSRRSFSRRVKASARNRELDYRAISPHTGLIVDRELLEKRARALFGEGAFRKQGVAISIPSTICFLTHIQLEGAQPKLKNAEVLARLREYLPCDVERLVVDFRFYAHEETGASGIVACAVKRDSLAPYIQVAASLGLTVVFVVPSILAVANYVESLQESRRRSCFAVVNVEGRNIEVLVCDRGIPKAHDRIIMDVGEVSDPRQTQPLSDERLEERLLLRLSQAIGALQSKIGNNTQMTEVVLAGNFPLVDLWAKRLNSHLSVPCVRPIRIGERHAPSLVLTDRRDLESGLYDDALGLFELDGNIQRFSYF